MGSGNFPLYAFNRGEVSRLALGRVDLDRLRLSAEEQVNWQPMVLGPMTLRPGLKYLGETLGRDNLKPVFIPFVFGNDDTATLEIAGVLRVWLPSAREEGDLKLIERPAVATTVPHGEFNSADGWDLHAHDGCSASIETEGGKDRLVLSAPARGGIASCKRELTVDTADDGKEHAFRIRVLKGPVRFRAGPGPNSDRYIATTELAEGTHSLAFKPKVGSVHICFETNDAARREVKSIQIEEAGVLTLPAQHWDSGKLPYIRHAQSGDVVFVACRGVHPYRIERRSARSWSLVKYQSPNGPLKPVASAEMWLKPSAMVGNGRLTSQRPLFTQKHVGSLFRLFSPGQTRQCVLAAEETYTDPIRITGVGGGRKFAFVASGDFKGTLTLQRSTEDGDLGVGFVDVGATRKSPGRSNFFDSDEREFDNVIAYYRVGFKEGEYISGHATVRFEDDRGGRMNSGGGAGICRVIGVTSSKTALIEILSPFSSLAPTTDWQEGEWSDEQGYPSAVAFHDGRLWWAGRDKIWGSVSDDYSNFDIEKEGDAGPISRSVGYGPVHTTSWMLPLTRLILGREGAETSVRASSLDDPITPTSFTVKDCSTKGSARIAAIKSDTRGVFVSRSGRKAYELSLNVQAGDYAAHDLTRLHPDIAGKGGFTRLCFQQQPDPAVHFVRSDGQVAVLLYDKEDEVEAWWRVETDGMVQDAFVLPGATEDNVYYMVRRIIGGDPKYYLERFTRRDQCSGRAEARLSDSHILHTAGGTAIGGLSHLRGEQVVAWAWNDGGAAGVDLGTFTVEDNGQITPATAYDKVCVGLPYSASFTSAKLAYAADRGTAVNQKKRVDHIGLILYDTHCQGLQYGQRADVLDNLPLVIEGAEVAADRVHAEFDEPMIEVPGEWDTDSRLVLKAASPRPCTVAAAVIGVQTHG